MSLIPSKNLIDQLPADKKYLLAISGGPDSIFLLHQLLKIQKKKNITLHLAHLNHNTRKQDSIDDQKFVEKIAVEMDLPFTSYKLQATSHKLNEAKLRQLRYKFLEKTRIKTKSDFILTAHHQDDQIETIIFNFIRGTGPTGLTGMTFKQGHVLRPLLDIPKKNILQYLHQNKIKYRIDNSNQDTKYTRNFIRHKLIPIISKINPNPNKSLLQLSQIITSQQNYLNQETYKHLTDIIICTQVPIDHWILSPYFGETKKADPRRGYIEYSKLNNKKPILILSLPKFRLLHPAIQTSLIKTILTPFVPINKQLTHKIILEIQEIILHSQGGSQKLLFNSLSISKKNDKIYLHIVK